LWIRKTKGGAKQGVFHTRNASTDAYVRHAFLFFKVIAFIFYLLYLFSFYFLFYMLFMFVLMCLLMLRLRPCRRLPPLVFSDFHWCSMVSIVFNDIHWLLLKLHYFQWFALISNGFQWFPLSFIEFSMVFIDFQLIFMDFQLWLWKFHWFSMVFNGFHWFSNYFHWFTICLCNFYGFYWICIDFKLKCFQWFSLIFMCCLIEFYRFSLIFIEHQWNQWKYWFRVKFFPKQRKCWTAFCNHRPLRGGC